MSSNREYLPSFAELVDMLTIDQIKLVKLPDIKDDISQEILKLSHDIDTIILERDIKLTTRVMRIIIVLAQMNLHIWENKDRMTEALEREDDQAYLAFLKTAHQLNGLRNQAKNILMEQAGDKEKSGRKTNFNVDGLTWDIQL